jgi:hypothetical protein
MGRQVAIAFALLAACGVLLAAMAWATAARGPEPSPARSAQSPRG